MCSDTSKLGQGSFAAALKTESTRSAYITPAESIRENIAFKSIDDRDTAKRDSKGGFDETEDDFERYIDEACSEHHY